MRMLDSLNLYSSKCKHELNPESLLPHGVPDAILWMLC